MSNNLISYAETASKRLKFKFPYDIRDWVQNKEIGRASCRERV